MNRQKKRITIITVFAIMFLVFISLVFSIIISDPTCSDGKQNQGEEGIDCGGPCATCEVELTGKNLIVKDSHVIYGGEMKYDVVASLHNPNALFGGEKVFYTIEIIGSGGDVLDTRSGETFILPNENKYLVEIGLETAAQPVKVETTIERVDWVKFTNFESPQILVKNQKVGLVERGSDYAQAFGIVSNESSFDFHNVGINVIIFDERGVPIAANKTVQRTLDADTQREFVLNWPHEFPGTIKNSEMQAETNVFDSSNFMKKYLPGGRYQELGSENE
ncbi:MAG: hypothetical protein CR972_02975 [Candidatus Moraniibacteriota bacterium]|nr:MAG: hypothetical protein CR972_02975 [Candidatus Moranbacteria bacterium]